MDVLITGGAGFIGSHLAERLLGSGHRVCVVDNLSSVSAQNIEALLTLPQFRFVPGSVTPRRSRAELVSGADTVYHLAAGVGVQLVVDNPIGVMETNIHGTEVVLELAARRRTRVLLTSSSEVYGRRRDMPFR